MAIDDALICAAFMAFLLAVDMFGSYIGEER